MKIKSQRRSPITLKEAIADQKLIRDGILTRCVHCNYARGRYAKGSYLLSENLGLTKAGIESIGKYFCSYLCLRNHVSK